MRRLLLAALVLSAAPSVSMADTILDTVAVTDCDPATRVLSNEKLRDKILSAAKVPFTSKTLALYNSGRFGRRLEQLASNCGPDANCSADERALADAYELAAPLEVKVPEASTGFTIEIAQGTAPLPEQRAVAFLNGEWSWLSIRCEAASSTPTPTLPGGTTTTAAASQDPLFPPPKIVIAKVEEDAGKDFDKRGFATIGYSSDKVADKTSFDMDLYVGLSDAVRWRNSSLRLQPFVAYQRHSQKKVDDLSVGAALLSYPQMGGQIRVKAAWETDHEFVASVVRADVAWTTPFLDLCEMHSVPGDRYSLCELSVVADVADIREIGRKTDLAKLSSFERIGGDLAIEIGQAFGDRGFFSLSAKYQGRHDIHGEADAERAVFSLGFAPSKTGPYKVSVDYTNGRDLTSLAKQRTVVLSFGFRN